MASLASVFLSLLTMGGTLPAVRGHADEVLVRGPYLQSGSSHAVVIRWRTDTPEDSLVRFGATPGELTAIVHLPEATTEHVVHLENLVPATRYHYSVGSGTRTLAGGDLAHHFVTAPERGHSQAVRIWVLGDSGTADDHARSVRDAYYEYAGDTRTDFWIMLGDNAYDNGTDAEYQLAVFENMYGSMLRSSVLWPTLGNHDGISANSGMGTGPYFDIFSLPTQAEVGGVASGTEAYHSFDYGDLHLVNLDSYGVPRGGRE